MASVKITVRKNGPYRVEAPEGTIELVDADGNKYDLTGKPAFSLCRCGGSVNKPFCDGSHNRLAQAAKCSSGPAPGASNRAGGRIQSQEEVAHPRIQRCSLFADFFVITFHQRR